MAGLTEAVMHQQLLNPMLVFTGSAYVPVIQTRPPTSYRRNKPYRIASDLYLISTTTYVNE